jgi:uncharacterized membrane protein YeaQ/YmgE (transglycosylase-associated protein family)
MGILSWIVVGLIAGFLASVIVRGSGYGVIWDIIVGILGALIGGWISATWLHIGSVTGINITSILIALLGAVILLLVLRLFRRRS